MKLSSKTALRMALIEGIANILTAISLIGVIVSLGKIIFSGYNGWQKDLFVYCAFGAMIIFLISRVVKRINRENLYPQ